MTNDHEAVVIDRLSFLHGFSTRLPKRRTHSTRSFLILLLFEEVLGLLLTHRLLSLKRLRFVQKVARVNGSSLDEGRAWLVRLWLCSRRLRNVTFRSYDGDVRSSLVLTILLILEVFLEMDVLDRLCLLGAFHEILIILPFSVL